MRLSAERLDSLLVAAAAAVGGTPRPGQVDMARAVASSIDRRRHLLVQAGTGTGKSLAYLVPAIEHAIHGGSVIVATATLALQRQLIERDLPRITAALAPLLDREPTFAVLKGRHNYVCLERLHRAEGEDDDADALIPGPRSALGKQAKAVRQWAEATETGDRDEFGDSIDARIWRGLSVSRRECVGESRCAYGAECFTARRREEAMAADIVVTNHAMLAIHVIEGIPVLPEHDAIVIDEAHEVVDRLTGALTLDLAPRSVEVAAQRAGRFAPNDVVDDLLGARDYLVDALAGLQGRLRELPEDLVRAVSGVRDRVRATLSAVPADDDPTTMAARQRARGALDELLDASARILTAGPDDVIWVDGGGTLRLAPLQIADRVREDLFRGRSVVLTSATLTVGGTFDALASGVGLDGEDAPEWEALDVGSPFDYPRQGILYVARHLPPPGRDGLPEEALDEIADLVQAAGGRALVLCSSWRAVDRVGEYLGVRGVGSLLVQQRGDTVAALVDRFTDEAGATLVGTLSLWQGVDVPGDACILVIIDRIPFPRPDDPVLAARQERVDAAGGRGFWSVSVPRAGLLLAQGAGRLIRDTTDRGVVAVLDPRLATARYSGELRASLPPMWFTTDREAVLGSLRRLAAAAEA